MGGAYTHKPYRDQPTYDHRDVGGVGLEGGGGRGRKSHTYKTFINICFDIQTNRLQMYKKGPQVYILYSIVNSNLIFGNY
jgi:hypothetical protein